MSQAQPRPGSIVTTRTAPPPRTIPTDTGPWFVAGTAEKGPLKPVSVTSLQEYINNFGSRTGGATLYDSMETYFREGGQKAIISRVVGPANVIASVNLDGSTAGGPTSLTVKAKGPGSYANTLRVTVVGGGGTTPYTLTISDTVLGTLEVSPSLADQNAAVAWSQASAWVDITVGGEASNPVAVSNAALTGGADDSAGINDAAWLTALNRFTKDYGPGQVSAPGRTTTTGYQQVREHAMNQNRWAILDGADTSTSTTLTSAVTSLRTASPASDRYGMLFAPWVVIPGLVPNTTRIVPPSALVAAKVAFSDGRGNSPNRPAAGNPEGVATWVIGLSQNPYDDGSGIDVTRDTMYSGGVNLIVTRFGVIEIFGWRSMVDPNGSLQDWLNAGNGRLNMAITAKASAIAENYILDEIDGFGRLFKQFEGDLVSMLQNYYVMGSLYGTTPEEAFIVDTGPTVNTPATIANRELHAAIACRMSQDAELVVIEISKVPVSQSLVAV